VRAFIAINLPAAERARLHAAAGPLRDAGLSVRWVAPESLHLTLAFLGNIDDRKAEQVEHVLVNTASHHARFDMVLQGIGAFPSVRRARVWWAGIADEPRLLALQADVERGLEIIGFRPEARAWSPHITLGRATGGGVRGRSPDDIIRAFEHDARVPVESIDLMQSHLSPRGARYERVLAAGLAPAPRAGVDQP
jgi:2'-5' RNA ligase